jgi:hypothetical protein
VRDAKSGSGGIQIGMRKALRMASFRNRSTVRLVGEVRYVYTTGDGEVIATVKTCG